MENTKVTTQPNEVQQASQQSPQQTKPKYKFPTETVELPSKGKLYPKSSPLSLGVVEMKYMTAKEEDIITNSNYINNGTVIDKLLEALIVTPNIQLDDLILGDKNALLMSARVLGYGKDYVFEYYGEEQTVDLSALKHKEIDWNLITEGVNEFSFTLPHTDTAITFQLITGHLEKKVEAELKGLTKINKKSSAEMSTRLKHMLLSVNGDSDKGAIREYVDNYFLARDARSFREYIKKISPDVEMVFNWEGYNGESEEREMPIKSNFFFPDAGPSL
jgi:hypothetical protein